MPTARISDWLRSRLACPYDRLPLAETAEGLRCAGGHTHRVLDGIPVLLRDDVEHTHHLARHALTISEAGLRPPSTASVDAFVQEAIAATGGIMYRPLLGKLVEYPIPLIRLPPGGGTALLDIGCNWGRWTIAAARGGYRAIGLDPSIEAVRSARRVARQLGTDAEFVVGDARHLPFRDGSLDTVFSYSVLQHFSKADVRDALVECRRILTEGGLARVQMPNAFGLRCVYHQARRGFREGREFEVRYWTPGELRESFEACVGPTTLSVDGFFSLNPQPAEAPLLPLRFRGVVAVSEFLRRAASALPFLLNVADSLYVDAVAGQRDARPRRPETSYGTAIHSDASRLHRPPPASSRR